MVEQRRDLVYKYIKWSSRTKIFIFDQFLILVFFDHVFVQTFFDRVFESKKSRFQQDEGSNRQTKYFSSNLGHCGQIGMVG